MRRLILVCVTVMFAPAAAAQIYECVDARGVKLYTHFCPPGTVQQRQILKEAESAPGPAQEGSAPKSIDAQDLEYRKRLLERQEAETKATQEMAQAEEFERNCLDARAQLKAVLDGMRMERVDPVTGERIQFGDAERASEAETQRKAIAQWCK